MGVPNLGSHLGPCMPSDGPCMPSESPCMPSEGQTGQTRCQTEQTRFQTGQTRGQTGQTRGQTSKTRFHAGQTRFQTGQTRDQTGQTRGQTGQTRGPTSHVGRCAVASGGSDFWKMAPFCRQVLLAVVQWPPAGQIFLKWHLEKTRADHMVKTAPPELKTEPYGTSYDQKLSECEPQNGGVTRPASEN